MDSYIKAFRWSTDRLDKNGGIISFISNGAWLDGNSTDGFRKCLEKEFTSIYIFNLRGNARTSGELRQKEGGGVFGLGSRTPISITLLVKNPDSKNKTAKIFYHDIGDYLSQQEKLAIIKSFHSISNENMNLIELTPNEQGDWLNQRNNIFEDLIPLGDKEDKKNISTFFIPYYGRGIASSRDAWVYNSSRVNLVSNINKTIEFYNLQKNIFITHKQSNSSIKIEDVLNYDSTKISWGREFSRDVNKNIDYVFKENCIVNGFYRPFFKQYLYFAKEIHGDVYQLPKLFPNKKTKNLVICATGVGASKDFSLLITDCVPDLQLQFNGQCFPLYYYEERKIEQKSLFDSDEDGDGDSQYISRDGISNFIFERAQKQYGKNVTKEDIFYYVYGFLHSPEYREMFANDLKKMLPRLPLLEDVREFWAFSKAGRKLAELHINYESVPAFEGVTVKGVESGFFNVQKMRFPKKDQKDTIIFNSKITIENIPAQAYEYVVNGKSAIEWIMERYQVTTHKESQIKNDPNDWAEEVGNPRYILDLLLSIINVSIQTTEIVKGLPKVKFE